MRAFLRWSAAAAVGVGAGVGGLVPPASATEYTAFLSPSKKIECTISRTEASCANDKTYRTTPPASSDCGSGSSAVNVWKGGAGLVCIGNDFGARRTLGYGKTIRRGRYSCTSSTAAMTCRNRVTKHGFRLSRDGWRFF
ncbi:MAG: hypothetical protein F2817_02715 [Actinobacteria bacterium]|nr:hypothetical protein [Actinomycetota bacterium]